MKHLNYGEHTIIELVHVNLVGGLVKFEKLGRLAFVLWVLQT